MLQKFAGPLVGTLFVGAPVRPNMLNMPKSTSGHHHVSCGQFKRRLKTCLFGLTDDAL